MKFASTLSHLTFSFEYLTHFYIANELGHYFTITASLCLQSLVSKHQSLFPPSIPFQSFSPFFFSLVISRQSPDLKQQAWLSSCMCTKKNININISCKLYIPLMWQISNKYYLTARAQPTLHCFALRQAKGSAYIEWTEWIGWFLRWDECKGRGWGRHKALQFIVLKGPTALLGGRWKWIWEEESDRWDLVFPYTLSLLRVAPLLPLLSPLSIAFINWNSASVHTHVVTLDLSTQRNDTK